MDELTSSIRQNFRCDGPFYMVPVTYSSPVHPPWRYPRFLQLLVASSRSESMIYDLPNQGLSSGERTARMIWHRQFISIFDVLDHCKLLLGHRPHQFTPPDCILYFCSFWPRIAYLSGGLLCYLIRASLQVSEPHGWVYIFNLSKKLLCWTIVHCSWAIYLTNAPSLMVYSIYKDSGRV